ncbi:MAG: DUF4339 domain-containing protein [Phycisphaerales bacterium]|nr:DUF4339 domain-containing protein [Phycisphaerales bacterium]
MAKPAGSEIDPSSTENRLQSDFRYRIHTRRAGAVAHQWHYSKNGQTFGPVDGVALKQLASSGQLLPTDLVWKEGMPEWSSAEKVKGLFASTPPLPTQFTLPIASQWSADQTVQIWNPDTAAVLSVFFTSIFRAYIHTLNWRRLGEPARAASSMMWVRILTGVHAFILLVNAFAGVATGNANSNVSLFASCATMFIAFGALLAWYFASARSQVAFVKERFPNAAYTRCGWGKPIGI